MDEQQNDLNMKLDPSVSSEDPNQRSGEVRFDDRGNAVWETGRGRQLEHPSLTIADELSPNIGQRANPLGVRAGYNPYESGVLGRKDRQHKNCKKDLRALSKWIEAKKISGK